MGHPALWMVHDYPCRNFPHIGGLMLRHRSKPATTVIYLCHAATPALTVNVNGRA
jgi:hypothetical protein